MLRTHIPGVMYEFFFICIAKLMMLRAYALSKQCLSLAVRVKLKVLIVEESCQLELPRVI